jgi:hypothetical protein
MTTFLDKLKQLLRLTTDRPPQPDMVSGTTTAVITQANIQRLAHLLALTDLTEYSCEETFELLDEYVDLVDNNAEAEILMPVVKQHLDRCPHCREAFEDLLHALQPSL